MKSPSTISSKSAVPLKASALTGAPETIMLSAASTPMARGRRCVPPAPGSSPSFTSGSATCAPTAATRKWQPSDSSSPPPMHVPLIAAITGFAPDSTTRITVCRPGSAVIFGVLNSLMSAPPENTPLAPVIMIAFTAGSALAASSAATSDVRTARPSPFTGGIVEGDHGDCAVHLRGCAAHLTLLRLPAIPCARNRCPAGPRVCLRTRSVRGP